MKKIFIVLLTFFGLVSCTNQYPSSNNTSSINSETSSLISSKTSQNSTLTSNSSSLLSSSPYISELNSSISSNLHLSSSEEIGSLSISSSSISSSLDSKNSSSSKVSSAISSKPNSSSSLSSNKVETYNPDGTVKLPLPTYSINSTWGQNGKFYEIDNSFPEGFSCIWGKQIIDEPVCYASGSWKITYPNTGTRMGFQSPLFEEDLKLEIWFTVSEIHGNTDKLDEDNPWIRIYGYSSDGKLIRTKDIESPSNFTEREYHYAFNGEGVNYFEIRFLSQPHKGTKCYNFGISEIGVKSFPYAYND